MTDYPPFRAAVAPSAIARVTRLFNGSLDDILAELFQNARRAGATRVEVTCDMDAQQVTLSDDGRGVADPAQLLMLGSSAWDAELIATEDAAGMGFFALAGRAVVLESSVDGVTGFRLAISENAWTGETELEPEDCSCPIGTRIAFDCHHHAQGVAQAVARAALYYPLIVTFDDRELPRRDFLQDAKKTFERGGYRIGIFRHAANHAATINFHGLTIKHRLPEIREVDGPCWSAKIDIIGASPLKLVLPARKELYQDSECERIIDLVRDALFRTIIEEPTHRLSFEDWELAQDYGINMGYADEALSPWEPGTAHESHVRHGEPKPLPASVVAIPHDEALAEQLLARAITRSAPALAGRLVFAEPAFKGYAWYDAIPKITGIEAFIPDLDEAAVKAASLANERVPAIIVRLPHDKGPTDLPLDIFMAESEDCWPWPDDVILCLSDGHGFDPARLADFMTDALFSPSDDCDAGSWQDQYDRYRTDALHRAFETLKSGPDIAAAKIEHGFGEHLRWLIPKGYRLELSAEEDRCAATLVAVAEAAQPELQPG